MLIVGRHAAFLERDGATLRSGQLCEKQQVIASKPTVDFEVASGDGAILFITPRFHSGEGRITASAHAAMKAMKVSPALLLSLHLSGG